MANRRLSYDCNRNSLVLRRALSYDFDYNDSYLVFIDLSGRESSSVGIQKVFG